MHALALALVLAAADAPPAVDPLLPTYPPPSQQPSLLTQRLRMVPEDPLQGSYAGREVAGAAGGELVSIFAASWLSFGAFKLLAPSYDSRIYYGGLAFSAKGNGDSAIVPGVVAWTTNITFPALGAAFGARLACADQPRSGSVLRAFGYGLAAQFVIALAGVLIIDALHQRDSAPANDVLNVAVLVSPVLMASYGLHDGPIHWVPQPVASF